MLDAITKNWKTGVTGLVTILLGIPSFVSALTAWGNHQAVDWRSVLVSTALIVIGAGLTTAKDASTHSTVAEVNVATVQAKDAAIEASKPDLKK